MKALVPLALLALLLMAAPASAYECPPDYIDPGISVDVNDDSFRVYVGSENAGLDAKLKADNVVIWEGTLDPYLSWSAGWPQEKGNHRLALTIDGERYVWHTKWCAA